MINITLDVDQFNEVMLNEAITHQIETETYSHETESKTKTAVFGLETRDHVSRLNISGLT